MLRASHDAMLDALERSRAEAFARPQDRSRFVTGAALLKLAVADATGLAPDAVVVDRTCDDCGEPHGRPRICGERVHVSVAHSGSVATVALTLVGPVGVDVEQHAAGWTPVLSRRVLAPSERIDSEAEFLTYWCRKESVVKATGEGLRVPFPEVIVTPPDRPPGLISYRGNPMPGAMFDLELGYPGYAAALTVLTSEQVRVQVDSAAALMRG
jgi:4'-phosphopantetheinyl transferase